MKKLGHLISPSHQLCYAHGVQLGIIDTIYKKQTDVEEPVIESQIYFEMDESTGSDSEDDVFHCSIPRTEVDLDAEYVGLIISSGTAKASQPLQKRSVSPTPAARVTGLVRVVRADEFPVSISPGQVVTRRSGHSST
ncbi:hypothetical protein EVAR_28509_1 [Eumeta japonica]|uniref:Uncharacterized protein n=1 Tax=Eumeta variegata TaxID=151549 RepID=A0A4C1WSS4_EUMVA|nr:hypothetical protein EVAR_28509_1 [Eumeta japonica]